MPLSIASDSQFGSRRLFIGFDAFENVANVKQSEIPTVAALHRQDVLEYRITWISFVFHSSAYKSFLEFFNKRITQYSALNLNLPI